MVPAHISQRKHHYPAAGCQSFRREHCDRQIHTTASPPPLRGEHDESTGNLVPADQCVRADPGFAGGTVTLTSGTGNTPPTATIDVHARMERRHRERIGGER